MRPTTTSKYSRVHKLYIFVVVELRRILALCYDGNNGPIRVSTSDSTEPIDFQLLWYSASGHLHSLLEPKKKSECESHIPTSSDFPEVSTGNVCVFMCVCVFHTWITHCTYIISLTLSLSLKELCVFRTINTHCMVICMQITSTTTEFHSHQLPPLTHHIMSYIVVFSKWLKKNKCKKASARINSTHSFPNTQTYESHLYRIYDYYYDFIDGRI